jgi:thioredoxin reductase (NADPH)
MTRPLKNMCEVAVIGGGLAGLSAARHVARLGRHVTLFEGTGLFGGQVATIDEVDGIPVPGKFSGQDLAIHLLDDARKAAVHVVEAGVVKLELGQRLCLADEQHRTYQPEAIIVASGA